MASSPMLPVLPPERPLSALTRMVAVGSSLPTVEPLWIVWLVRFATWSVSPAVCCCCCCWVEAPGAAALLPNTTVSVSPPPPPTVRPESAGRGARLLPCRAAGTPGRLMSSVSVAPPAVVPPVTSYKTDGNASACWLLPSTSKPSYSIHQAA